MNCDSRFRKSPEFVLYYLWQKELRELSSGIYNVLNSTSRRHQTVKQFVDGINGSDASIEVNLCTVLQSVRGTKQFWYRQKGDVLAMIREFECPTLFLTFSCAEYDSVEIGRYLRKVNILSHTKLYTEDPISVSRKFTQKFRDFFSTVLLKGQVLGEVTHYFWKKEYQSRGAPHYHLSEMHRLLEWILKTKLLHGLIKELLAISQMKRLALNYTVW